MIEHNSSFDSLAAGFIRQSITRLEGYKLMADKATGQLTKEQLFSVVSPGSNSIAVIMQHMGGNMVSRWTNFLTEDGEKTWRDRDREFEQPEAEKADQKALLDLWEKGWACLLGTLQNLRPADLEKNIAIRGEQMKAYDAIIRQLMHYSGHVGQIVYVAKMLKKGDWQPLTIAKNQSQAYNESIGFTKDKQ